ncbi:MAG: conjugal transfer protein [Actinobacteria bacterium]|nr:conjugal transfer protein [Actinomycetota bacterium]
MSMCVRYAGDSYTYLLDSVTTDHGRPAVGASPMTRYYAAHGTPPGTWLGAGLTGLAAGEGLPTGSFVTPVQMERLFANGEDPATGTRLGQSPHVYTGPGDRRRPVAGFDCTFTAPKSVSVLWALADGPTREAIYDCHRQAITDVLTLIERDVARTRIGTNGTAQVDVAGVIAAAFDHWDSRENDPNLHTHVVIANRARGPDGRWRTLDSRALHRAVVAMSERYDTLLADHLTTRLGLTWEYRERGPRRNPAFELTTIPQQLLDLFSRRSAAIDVEVDRLIDKYQTNHGRRPEPTTIIRLRQQATLATREAKEVHSLQELTDEWRRRAATTLGTDSSDWVQRALTAQRDPLPTATPAPSQLVDDAATMVLAVLSRKRATWTAWNIDAEASRALKAHRFPTPAARDQAVAAVVAAVQARSVLLTPPEAASTPTALRRTDGMSAFRPHRGELYTAQATLDAENSLLTTARDTTGPTAEPEHLTYTGLFDDQAAAVRKIARSGRVLDILVGPAGAGKTHTLAALRATWEAAHGSGSVVGLAPSAAAAEVLGNSLGVPAENTTKWIVEHDQQPDRHQRLTRAKAALPRVTSREAAREIAAHVHRLTQDLDRWRFHPGQLVIIDEASLAGTADLDRITACAAEAGAKILLVGDWAQLSAIDAGGAFGLVVRDRGAGVPELGAARRFQYAWERHAAGLLRVGDPEALRYYDHHQRIADGDHDTTVEKAYSAWATDEAAGKTSLLLAGDTDTVRALNHRAHSDLVTSGRVTPTGTRLHDGLEAGGGDRVVTRRNDRHLLVGPRWVKNGDTFTVTHRHDDGALTVQRLGGGPTVTLPAPYVREHVELGYATTAFRAQGATVDTAHAIVTGPGMTREVLYVMLTRARETNTAYVCTDRPVEPLPGFDDQATTVRSVLTAVMGNVGAAVSAHESADLEREQAVSIRTLAAEYETIAHHAQTPRWTGMLARAGLTLTQLDQVTASPAFGALSTALRRAEAHGMNIEAALPCLLERADAGTVDLASVVNQRVERWTDSAPTATALTGARFVLGLLPAATAADPEMQVALQDRVRLMDQRANELIDRARTANAPWLAQLGAEPTDPQAALAWRTRARTVAAYRERHQITDVWGPLGTVDERNAQQRRESAIAARAIAELRPQTPSLAPRPAAANSAPTRYSDVVGR